MRRRITTAKREEIRRQQEQLSQTINRPFELLLGLPVSYNKPPYGHYEDVIKNPLTIKDSAVLYTSLLRSRYNHIYIGPMFRLYWMKQTAYAKKLADELKKEEVYLARNTRHAATVKKVQAAQPPKERDPSDRIPVLSTDVSARDVMVKLSDAALTIGPHNFQVRLFIAKDERSDKRKKMEAAQAPPPGPAPAPAPAPVSKPVAKPVVQPTPKPAPKPTSRIIPPLKPLADDPEDDLKDEDESPSGLPKKPQVKVEKKPPIPVTKPPIPITKPPIPITKPPIPITKPPIPITKPPIPVTKPPIPVTKPPIPITKPPIPVTKPPIPVTKPPTPGQPPTQTPGNPPPKNPAADMQSLENTIMISNLNAIARENPSLNTLMKVVASGKASQEQITVFKGFIERARAMGPQPHHAHLFPGGVLPARYQSNVGRPRIIRSQLARDLRLTAFQEKYLHNATLLFEFVENPNVRYMIPQYAIAEVIPPSSVHVTEKKEDEDEEVQDIIVSFLWVHNVDEVEAYEKKYAEYEKAKKEREEEERKKKEEEERERKEEEERKKKEEEAAAAAEGDEAAENDEPAIKVEDKPLPPRRKKKAPPPRKSTVKRLDRPIEPEIKFTSVTLTFHEIPARLMPIVANSFKPADEVRRKMEHILAHGTRMPNFYLWYQVDGKLDERVAEHLRLDLPLEERRMPGIAPMMAKELAKKRKPKERAPYRTKRIREMEERGITI